MQYLLLIYEDGKRFQNGFSESEFAEYGAFGTKHTAAIKGGNALQPTGPAKTVRLRDGKALTTDGPFAETKEQLAGFYLLECKDLDEAIQWSSKIPHASRGAIEIRPVVDFSQTASV